MTTQTKPPVTKQELFDAVWDKYVTKKEDFSYGGGHCYYYLNGARCAAGHILHLHGVEDKDLDLDVMNYQDLLRFLRPKYKPVLDLLEDNDEFIQMLQHAHDDTAKSSIENKAKDMKIRMSDIADIHNLTIPE